MKKKFLSLMMVTCMVAMVLTGCGQTETSGDDAKASVEESKDDKEESDEESKEASKEDAKEESEEESVEESTEEVVESTEEAEESEEVEETEEVESTEEVEESEEVEETEEVDAEDTDANAGVESDIAKMYEGYMEKEDILPENFMMSANTTQDGITMDMCIAHTTDMDMIAYDLAAVYMNIYIGKDKAYCKYNIEGEDVWIWAPIESEEDEEELASMSDSTLVDPSTVTECVYRETVEEDGVVYDLLDLTVDDGYSTSTATYYVNRETQKIGKCVMEQDGASVVCLVEEIDTIELPAEAESATEGTVEDISSCMLIVVFAAMGMAAQ